MVLIDSLLDPYWLHELLSSPPVSDLLYDETEWWCNSSGFQFVIAQC